MRVCSSDWKARHLCLEVFSKWWFATWELKRRDVYGLFSVRRASPGQASGEYRTTIAGFFLKKFELWITKKPQGANFLYSHVHITTQRIRSMWHQSFFLPVYKKPEEYDLNHVTELRLNPGPAIHLIPHRDTTDTRGTKISGKYRYSSDWAKTCISFLRQSAVSSYYSSCITLHKYIYYINTEYSICIKSAFAFHCCSTLLKPDRWSSFSHVMNWHFPPFVALGSGPTLQLWRCRLIQ